jgi:hypothetical protein
MGKYLQEFFWMPSDVVQWLQSASQEFGLWVVLWQVGDNARTVDPDSLDASLFEGNQEDTFQIFLGSFDTSKAPVWRDIEGKKLLDFLNSYAVQLVPSIITPDRKTLFQGRLSIMPPDQYGDPIKAQKLIALFKLIQSSLKQSSDAGKKIVQHLANGKHKSWKNMLVGKSVSVTNMELKQFAHGEVVFEVE